MKTQKEYQVAAKAEMIANGGRSVGVLAELAKQGLTMHDGTHLPRIARLFCTTTDAVRKCSERHDELLQHNQKQMKQIEAMRMQIIELKTRLAQGIGIENEVRVWDMTKEEFSQYLKETWHEPEFMETVGRIAPNK